MIFKPSEIKRALIYLYKCFEKKRSVKIDIITVSKTLSQNSYLWLIFTHVAFETGNDKKDIYKLYLDKYPYFKEIEINGVTHNIQITLSGFNLMQCKDFIDKVTIDLRQEGFDVPDPEDLKTLDMYNYYKQNGLI